MVSAYEIVGTMLAMDMDMTNKYSKLHSRLRLFVVGGFYRSPVVHIARLSPAGVYWPTTPEFAKGNTETLDRLPDLFDMLAD